MPWVNLGTVTVGEEWKIFTADVVGSETIKLVHTTPIAANFLIGYFGRYFPTPLPGGLLSPWTRIYSSNSPVILSVPIPEDLKSTGAVVWTAFVKARRPYHLVPWQIQAFAFYPP